MSRHRHGIAVVLVFALSSCVEKAPDAELVRARDSTTTVVFERDLNSDVHLAFYRVKTSLKGFEHPGLVALVGNDGRVYEAEIEGAIDFDTARRDLVAAMELDGDRGTHEYVVKGFVEGSTYGAASHFVIWRNGLRWDLTRSALQRMEYRDVDGDGVIEAIEWFDTRNDSGEVYRFREGNWIRDDSITIPPHSAYPDSVG